MSQIAEEFVTRHPDVLQEDRTSARVVRCVAALTAPLSVYFRFRVHHLERVPKGACLIVGNHSIAAPHEILLLLRAWQQTFGDRPARGLVHRIAWQLPFRLFPLLQKIGGLFAHRSAARNALARGCAVLVFPGGDVEALRPFSARYRIEFAGRTGFIRLARDAGVPIVPIVICGSHAAYVMLPGSQSLARFAGVTHFWGFKAFPLTLGIAAAPLLFLTTAAFPFLWPISVLGIVQMLIPLPTRIEATVLDPIYVRDDESDEAASVRVQRAMQAEMDNLAEKRVTPWS